MASVMMEIEPKALWKHFAALSAIPRASEKEAAARAMCWARRRGWAGAHAGRGGECGGAQAGAAGTRERGAGAALQGHLDMVCEKNEGTAHDFDTDPIRWCATATG